MQSSKIFYSLDWLMPLVIINSSLIAREVNYIIARSDISLSRPKAGLGASDCLKPYLLGAGVLVHRACKLFSLLSCRVIGFELELYL